MKPLKAPIIASLPGMDRLVIPLGILALVCAHAWFLWSGALYYFVTRLALFPATVLLIAGILRTWIKRRASDHGRSNIPYTAMLGVLLMLSVCLLWSPLPYCIKDAGIRHRIQVLSGETRLQAWAEHILQTPLDQLPIKQHYGNTYFLDDSAFPDYVRNIPIRGWHDYSYRLVDDAVRGRYLEISVWHGRPEAWGVLIHSPSRAPIKLQDRWLHRWKAGMYGWQELNAVS